MKNQIVDNAIEWAKQHLNSTEYRLLCLAFVEDAVERGNNIEIFGGSYAKESSEIYNSSINKGVPPIGSFVFYDCFGTINDEYKNWGHVGLSIGEEKIIHALDKVRIDHYLDIQNLEPAPGWTKFTFSGWASIEKIMDGFKYKTY